MAQKTKNKRKNHLPNNKKEATPDRHSWPNLPHQLLRFIARKPTLMLNITSFGCVVKSWRSAPRHCSAYEKSPWPKLVEIDTKGSSDDHIEGRPHVIDIPFHEEHPYPYPSNYYRRSCKYFYPAHFKGHSHGYIAFFDAYSSFHLWAPAKRCKIGLPDWDLNIPPKIATLSSQPANLPSKSLQCSRPKHPNKCNVMVVTGMSAPAFVFHRLYSDEREWITENCTLKDPYAPEQVMQFTNAIGFDGIFYALSLQGSLVVIEDVNRCFKITGVSAHRAVPSKASRQYREFLVEVDGEILLVFLVSRKSINFVDDAEVFRLDVVKLLWVKVESLGEKTLFLEDECCMWVDAKKVGCKKNCIYFTHDRVDEWWVFHMENGSIVPTSGDGTKSTEFENWSEPG